MKDRRNLYRLLYAQPDAPLTVIQANHRVLIQKFKGHPDQDFADAQINLLNSAYTLLKDPLRRAAYDRQLQKRHPMNMLSLGSFASGMAKIFSECDTKPMNRRNYYRVLQIQPDAPEEIIMASHHVLRQYPRQDINLLDEAYTVLVNPATRMRYDVFLAGSWLSAEKELVPVANAQFTDGAVNQTALSVVDDMATSYCIFCGTAYTQQSTPYLDNKCVVCSSPLQTAIDEQYAQKNRSNIRISAHSELAFYLFWPDTPHKGMLQDLSPRGARFLSEVAPEMYDIIKIDAPSFRAVAEAIHLQTEQHHVSVGVRFLTIEFEQRRGNFLVVSA